MIDSIKCTIPVDHDMGPGGPFYGGKVLKMTADGEVEWEVAARHKIRGSFESGFEVRSVLSDHYPGRPCLRFEGSPAKVFQGHNVFGSSDLLGLAQESAFWLIRQSGACPSDADLKDIEQGMILVQRVDPTESYDLGTRARVSAALRAIQLRGNMMYRGGTNPHPHGLIFGMRSRRLSMMLYGKGSELEAHPVPAEVASSSVTAFAQALLRVEPRVWYPVLVEKGLQWACNWGDNTALELHRELLGRLSIAEVDIVDATTLAGLPGRLQVAHQAWLDGHDLRQMFARKTFYRYRQELLKHGVDIALPKGSRADTAPSNVVPLKLVFEAKMVSVPDWAIGTPLYFEPRAKVA